MRDEGRDEESLDSITENDNREPTTSSLAESALGSILSLWPQGPAWPFVARLRSTAHKESSLMPLRVLAVILLALAFLTGCAKDVREPERPPDTQTADGDEAPQPRQ